MDQNFLFFALRTQCYYPLLTPPLHTDNHMHAHKHTRVHLHTSAAPDLSGPAKPIEGLWRFICHSNVFLGKMPAQGEPRYSGRDTVVFSVSDKSCVSVSLSYSTSLRACVVCVCGGGGQYHKFMVIEMAESFGGNAVNLILRQKRSPYSICTQWHTRCDRETPESKRSYQGLTGFTTYPLHKSYLLITK